MRLPIETWIAKAALPEESLVAFNESVVAFKAGANRAALLFSYVGWGLALRYRLLNTLGPPTAMPQGQWDNCMRLLRDEDRWDTQVFDCTQMHSANAIFFVSEDIRHQVRYWKDRRNDCAHFKLNEINSAHVEAFWAFVRSNIGRFMPLGSEQSLIETILRHFNPNSTPPNADLRPVIDRIEQSMGVERLVPFLTDVRNALTTKVGSLTITRSNEYYVVLATCLEAGNRLAQAALELMLEDRLALVGVLRINPKAVGYLADRPDQVRQLWREDLFAKGHMDLSLYAALLRNDLIPDDQVSEAHDHVTAHIQGDIPLDTDVEVLDRSGFFGTLRAFAFEQMRLHQFGWGNANAPVIAWYIQHFDLDEVVVRSICTSLGATHHAFAVAKALRELLSCSPEKATELQAIATQIGLQVPASILEP
jgi:hypothetical protein